MIRVDRHPAVAPAAMLAIAALALTGCGTEEQADPGMSLRDSKTATQLLLNELSGRIPADDIISMGEQSDTSESCLAEAQDTDGTQRRWVSVRDINLVDTTRSVAYADDIVATYTEQDWSAVGVTESRANEHATLLTNGTGGAQVLVEPTTTGLHLESVGPCVITDGKDSDEVKQLEGRK